MLDWIQSFFCWSLIVQSLSQHRFRVVICFAAIYIIWGSTYLAIVHAIESIPPLLMSSVRMMIAGGLLYGIGWVKRESLPEKAVRRQAYLSGTLLVLANSFVCVAEKWVSSGLASVIVGTAPVWIIVFQWLFFHGTRPTGKQILGIAAALLGILLLTSDTDAASPSSMLGMVLLFGSVIIWAFGTLIQRKAPKGIGLFIYSGLQLFYGGVVVLMLSLNLEHPNASMLAHVQWEAVLAVLYLIVFGSVIAFSAYLWLSMHVEASKVSTYALVNPLVAVWLGWLFNSEPVYVTMVFSSLLIIVGLYFVLFKKSSTAVPAMEVVALKE